MGIHQLNHYETPLSHKKHAIVLLCDRIRIPDNVGLIFRISDALGVEKIIFTSNSPKPENIKVQKTSRSTYKTTPSDYSDDLFGEIIKLKKDGFTIIGLEITNKSIPLSDYKFSANEKIAIVIGSEREGIRSTILNQVDDCVEIPMYGKNSSMNVVHALSIALYEIGRQKSGYPKEIG